MPQGRQTSTDIQWTVIRLSRLLDHERIATCLFVQLDALYRTFMTTEQFQTR
jgi:hypothetical protein